MRLVLCLGPAAWFACMVLACASITAAQVPAEVSGLAWCSGTRDCLEWSPAADSIHYQIYRGAQQTVSCVAHAALDSCLEGTFAMTSSGAIFTETPDPGGMFWFLVTAVGNGGEGTAGNSGAVRRDLGSAGACLPSCTAAAAVCGGDGECCSVNCVDGLCQAACSTCPPLGSCGAACDYGSAQEVGYLDVAQAPFPDEVSGVAQSRVDPQVLWMHNDDEGPAELFAYTAAGTRVARYLVGSDARAGAALRWALPDRALDWLLARSDAE